jgi:hypothetical protein
MSNLLYCKTGDLKLCDLGLARCVSLESGWPVLEVGSDAAADDDDDAQAEA